MLSFISGGTTGETAESLRRKREVAQALLQRSTSRVARDPWEGIAQVGQALAGKYKERKADRAESEAREAATGQYNEVVAALGGMSPGALERSDRVGTPFVPPVEDGRKSPPPFDPDAIEASLSDDLVSRVIRQESGGNPEAVSPKGATGLMQIMPATARDPGFGIPDIFTLAQQMGRPVQGNDDATLQALLRDPEVNKAFGTRYLAAMLNRSGGDTAKALASYNAGPGAVDQYGGVPPFAETQNYVQAIMGGQPQTMMADAPLQAVPPAPQQIGGMTSGSGGLDPRILELAGNEFLNDGQRSVVQALLQNQMAQMAPSRPTDDMREYEMARGQGYRGSFFDFQRDIRAAGRSQTSVTVGGAQAPDPMAVAEAKGREKGVEALATSAVATFNEGRNAAQQLAQIDQLEGLLAQTPTGTVPAWQQWATDTLGIQVTGGPAQAVSAILNQLTPSQRPPGSGASSDTDVRMFKASLPQLVNTPEGNAEIIAGMRAIAEYKAVISQIAGDAVAGRMSYGDMTERMREADAALSANLRARREAMPDMYGKPESPDALRSRLRDLGVN